MLEFEEFLAARELLEKWVGTLADPRADFGAIDADGSGSITFDEFCDWSIKKNLDLDKDPSDEEGSAQEDLEDVVEDVVEDTGASQHEYDDGF